MYYNLRSVTNRMLFSSYICICLSRRLPFATSTVVTLTQMLLRCCHKRLLVLLTVVPCCCGLRVASTLTQAPSVACPSAQKGRHRQRERQIDRRTDRRCLRQSGSAHMRYKSKFVLLFGHVWSQLEA